jgi:hypothetical protein
VNGVRRVFAIGVSVAGIACSGDGGPTAASDNLSGRWTGTLQVIADGQTIGGVVILDLTQQGDSLVGSLTFSGLTGSVNGYRFGQTVTLSIGRFGGEPCTGLQRSMIFQVVSAAELKLSAVSGQVCNPFTGAVMNVTSGSGVLRKE